MKKLLIAATALTAMAAATPAFADGNNRGKDTEQFRLRANNPAKCNLEASNYTLRLPNNSLTDRDGVALTDIGATVASALNGAGVTAWCTGTSNKLTMYRSAFTADGTSGDALDSGFNQAAIYDVAVSIDGATRSDGTSPLEGTSDGKNNGVGSGVGAGLTLGRFGAEPAAATVTFEQEAGQTSSAVTNASVALEGATNAFNASGNRLIAGQYQSTLTIELTPGV